MTPFSNEESLLFLDCQTTGANPQLGHLLEVAWMPEGRELTAFLVAQPEGETVPSRIQFLTGITDRDLNGAINKAEIYSKLRGVLSPTRV